MRRSIPLLLPILICAGVLIGWNGSRFVGAKPKIRAKDLAFLPTPAMAKAMSLGQANTVAKLRWIDSFAYFQYQFDRQDDHVPGQDARGGFYRLYDTLTSLDPYFQPFYEHAALNLSGVLGRHHHALGFLMRGLGYLPHNTQIWRNTAATFKVHFQWEKRHPVAFDHFLAAWAEAEMDEDQKRGVWEWKRSMGERLLKGLEQLPYWLEQLRATKPKTPMGDYVEATTRAQLAAFGEQELTALTRLARRHTPPSFIASMADLIDSNVPLTDQLRLGSMLPDLRPLMDRDLIRQHYPAGIPQVGPMRMESGGRTILLPDPYGHAWRIVGNRVISPGLEQRTFEKKLNRTQSFLVEAAQQKGRWPTTVEELRTWDVHIPTPPMGGRLRIVDQQITVDWDKPPHEPWKLR